MRSHAPMPPVRISASGVVIADNSGAVILVYTVRRRGIYTVTTRAGISFVTQGRITVASAFSPRLGAGFSQETMLAITSASARAATVAIGPVLAMPGDRFYTQVNVDSLGGSITADGSLMVGAVLLR